MIPKIKYVYYTRLNHHNLMPEFFRALVGVYQVNMQTSKTRIVFHREEVFKAVYQTEDVFTWKSIGNAHDSLNVLIDDVLKYTDISKALHNYKARIEEYEKSHQSYTKNCKEVLRYLMRGGA